MEAEVGLVPGLVQREGVPTGRRRGQGPRLGQQVHSRARPAVEINRCLLAHVRRATGSDGGVSSECVLSDDCPLHPHRGCQ